MSESILIAASEYEALKKRDEQAVSEQASKTLPADLSSSSEEKENAFATIAAQNKLVNNSKTEQSGEIAEKNDNNSSSSDSSDTDSSDSASSFNLIDNQLQFLPRKDVGHARQLIRSLLAHPQIRIGTDGMISICERDLGHILLHLQLLYGNQKQIQKDTTHFQRFLQKTGLLYDYRQNSKETNDKRVPPPFPPAKRSKNDARNTDKEKKEAEKIVFMKNLDTFLK